MIVYYRSFISDFAGLASPLFATLLDSYPEECIPSEEVKQAVDEQKEVITQFPILQFPDFSQMFYLETDASSIRIAAVLMQLRDRKKELIAAASRTLTSARKIMVM